MLITVGRPTTGWETTANIRYWLLRRMMRLKLLQRVRNFPRALLRFAAIKRDPFGFLTKTHKTEAEICLDGLFPVVQADQRPADQMRKH